MLRRLLPLILILAACSGSDLPGTTASPTATTVPGPATTATPPRLVDGGLIEIDPATLVPTGADPIIIGDWHDGVVSPNGKWTAIRTWDHVGEANSINLVDLESNLVVASSAEYAEGPTVSDDGIVSYFSQDSLARIVQLGADGASVTADLPANRFALADTLAAVGEGRLGYLAVGSGLGPASLVVVDGDTVRVTDLPSVTAGSVESESEIGSSVFENLTPAVAWDLVNNRALVVSAEDGLVVAVDLSIGTADEHMWETPTGLFDGFRFGMAAAHAKGISVGVRRDAYVTADGANLFVATQTDELSGDSTAWTATSTSGDLLVIDTTTWEASVIDVQAGALQPSPDGSRLLATGATITSNISGDSSIGSSPVYVLDTASGDVLGDFEATTGTFADVQWSSDPGIFYIESSGEQANIDIVDLGFDQVVGSVGFREMSLIGEAGLMAFHIGSG